MLAPEIGLSPDLLGAIPGRTYMDAHLFNLPVLATICRASAGRCVVWVPGAVGHFPVYFTSAKNGVFAVDKEKNDEVDKRADAPV